jgi:hypothetical protein
MAYSYRMESEMNKSRFVEFDRESGELVLNLPSDSIEMRRIVLEHLDKYIARGRISESILDEIEHLVTKTLLEDSIKVD